MDNTVNYDACQDSIVRFGKLTERLDVTLKAANNLIMDNVGISGGIWVGDSANNKRDEWETLAKEFPTLVTSFQTQADNLNLFIDGMRNIDK